MATPLQLPPPLKQGQIGYPWTTVPIRPNPGIHYPKISIVTPSYQQGEFLEETIRSVLMQGYPNLEYIVMDGGSTDQSVDIIKHYSELISYWVSEKDQGQADAISRGFAHSTGTIMGWLNSDDILLPNALFIIAKTFMKKDNVMLVTGLRKVINDHSEFMYNWFHGHPTFDYIRHICEICQETTYWRRDIWEKVGAVDPQFQFAMDYDYWQRILHAGYRFTLIPHYLGGFRMHPDSKSSTLVHVHDQELQKIYQRYGIAQDYDDAVTTYKRDYDQTWEKRMRLLKDMRYVRLSNHAYFLVLLDNMMRFPLIGAAILYLHNQYRRLRGGYHD